MPIRHRSSSPAARILLPLALACLGALACTLVGSMAGEADEDELDEDIRSTADAATLEVISRATLDAYAELERSLTATANANLDAALPTATPTPESDQIFLGKGIRSHPYKIFDNDGNSITVNCSTEVDIELTLSADGQAKIVATGRAFF